jgi:hypothetical protein
MINDWSLAKASDPEIMQHIFEYESKLISSFADILESSENNIVNVFEKAYIFYYMIEKLGADYAFKGEGSIDLDLLQKEIVNMLIHMLQSNNDD